MSTTLRQIRQSHELRPIVMIPDYLSYPEGSVLCAFGETKVICNASVENKVPPFLLGKSQGWVTAEYAMLPRATHTRNKREAKIGAQTGRTQEIQRLIGRSLRSAVDLSLLGERQIVVDCDVIQADGGTRTAAITGAFVALSLAIKSLIDQGELTQSPIIHQVAAVSVGMIDGEARLDLDYQEDSHAQSDMNVVMTSQNQYVEIQGTAEGKTFTPEELSTLLALAQKGIVELFEWQQKALG